MGEAVVEQAQARHGKYRVEGVLFTNPAKQELATVGKQADGLVRIPIHRAVRDAHHAVCRTTTSAGNVRFDAKRRAKGIAFTWAGVCPFAWKEPPSADCVYPAFAVSAAAQTWAEEGMGEEGYAMAAVAQVLDGFGELR